MAKVKPHQSTIDLVKARRLQEQYVKLSRRIKNVRENGDNQYAVKEFEQLKRIKKKHGGSFAKMPTNRLNYLANEVNRIDNLKASSINGSKQIEKTATKYFGKQYSGLSDDDKSAVWKKFTKLKDEHSNTLDSDQILELMQLSEDVSGDLTFNIFEDKRGNTVVDFFIEGNRLDKRTKLSRGLQKNFAKSNFSEMSDILYKELYNL